MDKRIVIGLGTGRCGTVSFSKLMTHQGFESTHENHLMPWVFSKRHLDLNLNDMVSRKNQRVSDTAFYYLPYVEYLMSTDLNIRFVCLKRDRAGTVASYMNKTPGRNHWCLGGNYRRDQKWDVCYPSYNLTDKMTAIGMYWDDYYRISSIYQEKYPSRFRIFDYRELLNDDKTQMEVFKFLGIDGYNIKTNITKNALPK